MAYKKPVFALIDCNNFFVSCERLFRPELEGLPVVVLSNNDGCVVARSNEVRKLDVPMAAPYFKVKAELGSVNAHVFSANFQLYGDLSWRLTQVLRQFAPRIETYSVDEAFLDLTQLDIKDYGAWATKVSKEVKRQVGLPVSVGIAPTKTLAKLAADRAKKDAKFKANGGLALMDFYEQSSSEPNRGVTSRAKNLTEEILKTSPVGDVWGIGRRLGPKMRGYGVNSAWDLSQASDKWLSAQLSVKGLRTAKELRGESCIPLDEGSFDEGQKVISVTRTFGHQVSSMHELESAVATFGARIAAKLRHKKQLTSQLVIYLRTGKKATHSHYPQVTVNLPYPMSHTGDIIKHALKGLNDLPMEGISYKKSGIIAYNLVSESAQQMPLLGGVTGETLDNKQRAMQVIDIINRRYGKRTLVHASEGVKGKQWHAQRKLMSPAYTTSWSELPKITF